MLQVVPIKLIFIVFIGLINIRPSESSYIPDPSLDGPRLKELFDYPNHGCIRMSLFDSYLEIKNEKRPPLNK